MIFTSGSTGAPKAVRMTQGRAVRAGSGATWFGADDVLYCAMPLFHGNALNAVVPPALAPSSRHGGDPRWPADPLAKSRSGEAGEGGEGGGDPSACSLRLR